MAYNQQSVYSLLNCINLSILTTLKNITYSRTSIARMPPLFTMANSNSFLSPYEILSIAQENKYLGKLSYFIMTLYVVFTH